MDLILFDSPAGRLALLGEGACVTGLALPNAPVPRIAEHETPVLAEARRQVLEYLAGARRSFDLPLDPRGTSFQRRVWAALTAIPWGETRTYAQIAAAVGSPRAVRAVGQANHRNPIPILIPCHRVVGADGSLTGYAGGIDKKLWLLDHEGVETDRFFVPDNSTAP